MTSSSWDVTWLWSCVFSLNRGCANARRVLPVLICVTDSSCTTLLSRDCIEDAPDSHLQMLFKFMGYFLLRFWEDFFSYCGDLMFYLLLLFCVQDPRETQTRCRSLATRLCVAVPENKWKGAKDQIHYKNRRAFLLVSARGQWHLEHGTTLLWEEQLKAESLLASCKALYLRRGRRQGW